MELPSATNFDDIPVQERPDLRFTYMDGPWVHCPKCHGHGGWNLTLNAYGAGRHFKAACGQCNGYGWVKAGSLDETCVHDFVTAPPSQPFRCWHTLRCTKCSRTVSFSSDD